MILFEQSRDLGVERRLLRRVQAVESPVAPLFSQRLPCIERQLVEVFC